MKKAQLVAVIIIVLLVAAIGGFIIFSEKRAGEASRLSAAKQPSYLRYPPPVAQPPVMAELKKVNCEDPCEEQSQCPVGCGMCIEYYFSGVKRCQMTEEESRKAAEKAEKAEHDRRIKEEAAVLSRSPDEWLQRYCYPRCDDKLADCKADVEAIKESEPSLVEGLLELCKKDDDKCRQNCKAFADKFRR